MIWIGDVGCGMGDVRFGKRLCFLNRKVRKGAPEGAEKSKMVLPTLTVTFLGQNRRHST